MSNFIFLKEKREYAMFARAAIEAEWVLSTSAAMSAVGSRRALELAVKWCYTADSTMRMPYRENLQSLVHEPSFMNAVDHNTWRKFQFINDESLNQRQIAFIHKIITHVKNNGYMEDIKTLSRPPFDKPESFIKMFDRTTRGELIETINRIRDNAVAVI